MTQRLPRKVSGPFAGVVLVGAIFGMILLSPGSATRLRAISPTPPVRAESSQIQPQHAIADKSIAVLPFVSIGPGDDQNYLAEGIAEELLNRLARLPGLRVPARTSSFSFKDRGLDVPEIGRRLRVAHVLEGSVRRSGSRVRITAQLIDTAGDRRLWSQSWDREFEDIFAIEDDIAAAVIGKLEVSLLGLPDRSRPANPEAYALYLQARQLGRQYTAEGFEQAIALLQQALAIAPDYPDAWENLAYNYVGQTLVGLRPITQGVALAKNALKRALALAPRHAAAHATLGYIAMSFDNDLAAAARHYQHALTLAPTDVEVLHRVANLAISLGRLDTAISLGRHVVAQDPINPSAHSRLGDAYLAAGRSDEAIASMRSALRLAPKRIALRYSIGLALLAKNQPTAALADVNQEADDFWRLLGAAVVHHRLGNSRESRAALAQAMDRYPQDTAYNFAAVLAYCNETDLAFVWLDRAVADGDTALPDILVDPLLSNLHNHPAWQPLLRRLGRTPEQLATIRFDIATQALPGAEPNADSAAP